ncbi:hypothetical protein O181_028006 [Austropuccinia psidii MF-1]|uniref:Uncharacterized protein n=1 Tax=Austropuccinia psidii MF-1 TaxID=1389203 RepID=A0A9Q3H1Z4_9BASI|nr:hypothetical protein [Austropuccinia psidii MF-1]
MVKLVLTESIATHLAKVHQSIPPSRLSSHTLHVLENFSSRSSSAGHESVEGIDWIDHSTLASVSRAAKLYHLQSKPSNYDPISFFTLLQATQLYFKPKAVKQKSAQLEKIIQSIKLNQDKKNYNEMISTSSNLLPLSPFRIQSEERKEWLQVSKILTLIINILFSVFGTAFASFWLLRNSYHLSFDYCILFSFSSVMTNLTTFITTNSIRTTNQLSKIYKEMSKEI